ncbi:MAG: MFS transporter [Atopobiaceae bacterium]
MAQKFTKREKSWIVYDVGNSALVLLSTALIPIYFNSLAEGNALVAWSYAQTIASLVIALLMPFLGSLADMQGMKKKFIIGTVGTGVVATCALGIPTTWLPFLVIYIISSIMLNSSLVFYDSLLVDATTDERMDEVSSQGYAWGYIGSCVPFICCLAIVLLKPFGISGRTSMQLSFVITAAWWLAFTIPMLKNVEQTHYKPLESHAVSKAIRGLGKTMKNIAANKPMLYYIVAYFFYIDGVHTIINLATSYGSQLGIDSTQLLLALLVTQFVAFPSAIIYGKLGTKVGTKKMILVGIVAYACITFYAGFHLQTAVDFWILAMAVGLFQGGIQALSRSEFAKLVPKENSNEYFGFFDIFGKYSDIMGTLIVAVMTQLTGQANLGVFSIAILFVVGFIFMLKVPADVHAKA